MSKTTKTKKLNIYENNEDKKSGRKTFLNLKMKKKV